HGCGVRSSSIDNPGVHDFSTYGPPETGHDVRSARDRSPWMACAGRTPSPAENRSRHRANGRPNTKRATFGDCTTTLVSRSYGSRVATPVDDMTAFHVKRRSLAVIATPSDHTASARRCSVTPHGVPPTS